MKTALRQMTVLALASALFAGGAQAQVTGDTELSITLTGEMAILSFYSNLNVNVPVTLFAPTGCTQGTGDHYACATAGLQTSTATLSGGELDAGFTALAAPTLPAVLTNLPLILNNVWAVRSIGGASANAQLGIALGNATLSFGASQIGLVSAALRSTGATGTDTATISFPDPGLVTPRVGNVRINLNLTNATLVGAHVGGGAEYTLTLTNI